MRYQNSKHQTNYIESRDFRCPSCGGEFNDWERDYTMSEAVARVCPWCGTKKGGYDPESGKKSD